MSVLSRIHQCQHVIILNPQALMFGFGLVTPFFFRHVLRSLCEDLSSLPHKFKMKRYEYLQRNICNRVMAKLTLIFKICSFVHVE